MPTGFGPIQTGAPPMGAGIAAGGAGALGSITDLLKQLAFMNIERKAQEQAFQRQAGLRETLLQKQIGARGEEAKAQREFLKEQKKLDRQLQRDLAKERAALDKQRLALAGKEQKVFKNVKDVLVGASALGIPTTSITPETLDDIFKNQDFSLLQELQSSFRELNAFKSQFEADKKFKRQFSKDEKKSLEDIFRLSQTDVEGAADKLRQFQQSRKIPVSAVADERTGLAKQVLDLGGFAPGPVSSWLGSPLLQGLRRPAELGLSAVGGVGSALSQLLGGPEFQTLSPLEIEKLIASQAAGSDVALANILNRLQGTAIGGQ